MINVKKIVRAIDNAFGGVIAFSIGALIAVIILLMMGVDARAETMPTYTVIDATSIRNEQTGMIYALRRFEATESFTEGKAWLADVAFNNSDPRYPVFLPLQCKQTRPTLMLCEDIVLPQMKGDSITRTGITSGNMKEIQIRTANLNR